MGMADSTQSIDLQARQALQRKLYARLSPAERLARSVELQEAAMKQLRSGPGYEAFMRRNLRERSLKLEGDTYVPVSADRRALLSRG